MVIFVGSDTRVVLAVVAPCGEDAMKVWVDPPSGWRWGFPRVYDRLEHGDDMLAWLVKEGYPQAEIDRLGDHFFTRQWPADDTDAPHVGFRRGIPVNPRG